MSLANSQMSTETITNIIFGIAALVIGIITVWQSYKAWGTWHHHPHEHQNGTVGMHKCYTYALIWLADNHLEISNLPTSLCRLAIETKVCPTMVQYRLSMSIVLMTLPFVAMQFFLSLRSLDFWIGLQHLHQESHARLHIQRLQLVHPTPIPDMAEV